MENLTTYNNVEEWNAEFSRHLIPVSTLLFVYLIIGIVGNSVVIYLHQRHLKGKDRYFIPSLAIMDLMTCVANTCFSLSINMLPVAFNNDVACKIMWFINMSLANASALMLLAIAVYRYKKICKPFELQINLRWKNAVLELVALISILVSFPCFFFYGTKTVLHPNDLVAGHRCTNIRGPWSQTEPLIFKIVYMGLAVVVLVSLVVLYSLIGRTIYVQVKFRKANGSPQSRDTCDSSRTGTKPSTDIKSEDKSDNSTTIDNTPRKRTDKSSKTTERGYHFSILFMLISFILIACYIPKAGMMIWESKYEDFWTEKTMGELGIYRFLYTLYIVNNIVNPFIYGFFDSAFRKEFKKTFCRCRT